MKFIILIILVFTSTYCFAVDQNLIDGAKAYEVATKTLEEIEIDMAIANDSVGYWSEKLAKANNNRFESDRMRKFYQDKIDENNKLLQNLGIQHKETKQIIKQYESFKKESSKQVEIERKREEYKTAILNIMGMLMLPLSMAIFVLWGSVRHRKKYERLFKEGEITQEEYERIIQNSRSILDDERRNPATGLIVYGSVDAGGNPCGCSFKNNSMFDAAQDYRDRHRWE